MRPVTKPNPTLIAVPGGNNVLAYDYHTAASLTTNLTFAAGAVPTSLGAPAPCTRTVNRLLNILLQIAQGNNPYPAGTAAQHNTATGTIRDRLTDTNANPPGYRAANPQLDARLGHYCSFCEIYKPGHEIAVEHRLPKAPYPVTFVWWGNFLQACSRCNSSKGDRPNRVTAGGFALAPARANPYPFAPIPPVPGGAPGYRTNEQPLLQAVLEQHFWPDLDPMSFRRITYQMQDAGNGYAPIPSANAAIRMNNNATFYNYAVTADLQLAGVVGVTPNVATEIIALRNNAEAAAAANAATNAANLAAVAAAGAAAARTAAGQAASDISPAIGIAINNVAAAAAGNVAAVAAAVNAAPAIAAADAAHRLETNRTLNLTGLDVQDSARAGYRTRAWFKILKKIDRWEQRVATFNGLLNPLILANTITQAQANQFLKQLFDEFWDGLLDLAVELGFYSTIIELLLQVNHPGYAQPLYAAAHAPGGAFNTLAARFIFDTNRGNVGVTNRTQDETIPGTNVTFIP